MGFTSKLQKQVSAFLHENCSYFIRENYRPEWLISERGTRLELDFYVESIQLAIEVQGAQHYTYVEYFHQSPEKFKQRLIDDRYKKDYCESHGIRFVEICSEMEIGELSRYIKSEYHFTANNLAYITYRHPANLAPINPIQNEFHIHQKNPQQKIQIPATKSNELKMSDQGRFNMYTNRLHQWMLGELELDESKGDKRRFLKSAFHNFLQKYKRLARDIDKDPKFISFLESSYPDEKYKRAFTEMRYFIRTT